MWEVGEGGGGVKRLLREGLGRGWEGELSSFTIIIPIPFQWTLY